MEHLRLTINCQVVTPIHVERIAGNRVQYQAARL
jgi:hypothetical protein